ncbi:fructosamine kinase family protein [Streptomyces sp. ODS28]|uniref:fructosamine kinase family protein n=1 Tax=Streptomyces sp. ODS28 TaxID=3136688 RepID=UPI0031F12A13
MAAGTGLAARVARLAGAREPAGGARPVSGGDICDAYVVEVDGVRGEAAGEGGARRVFAKTRDGAPDDFFAAEAAGLARLAGTGAVAVPEVLAAEPDMLVLEWIEPGSPSPGQAERLGRELAALHDSTAEPYGTPGQPCYLGPLPLPSPEEPVTEPAQWPAFHAAYRLLPFLKQAADRGAITGADARDVERLCEELDAGGGGLTGPPQPPAVIHGDLWAGNVHWAADGRARLIDPAAQGGHPETDLALLQLFGCPQLSRILAAYDEVRPVPGRADRVPLHQLQHLLLHAALFGPGYGAQCGAAARAALG